MASASIFTTTMRGFFHARMRVLLGAGWFPPAADVNVAIPSNLRMERTAPDSIERGARACWEARDFAAGTTVTLRGLGPEVLRFLVALHHEENEASEVFSMFAEGVWRGFSSFAWSCSLRTWVYAVARKASLRYRRDEGRRARREVPLEEIPALAEVEQQVRSETLSFLRTEPKNRFAELRDALDPDDRALLILRVDRALAWNDLALAMHDGEPLLAGKELTREAARLRKRFQLLKQKLLEIGKREGLVSGDR